VTLRDSSKREWSSRSDLKGINAGSLQRIAELEAENVALRKLCGEVWAWDRSREREFGKIPGPLNVGLRTRLYFASNGEATDGE